jgi:ABC-type transport system involved in cytochrome c biogenesis permease subunit
MKVLGDYYQNSQDGFTYSVSDLKRNVISGMGSDWTQSVSKKVRLESWFNRVHPFRIAWIIYFMAFIVWLLARFFHPSNVLDDAKAQGMKKWVRVALPLTTIAFLIHVAGMVIRSYIAGRPPVTNMYESIVWVSFGTVMFSFILWWIQKNTLLFTVSTALGAIGLVVSDAAPVMIDPSIQPLVPVLRSNYWLTIHVLTITLSYAAFALTMGIGNVALWQYLKKKDTTEEGKKKTHAFKIIEIIPLEICLIQVITSKITIVLIIFIKDKWQSHIFGIILILLQETNLLNPK